MADHRTPAERAQLEAARKLAAAWHGSEEGRRWHRASALVSWKNRERVTRNCDRCGRPYETPVPDQSRYCSSNCSRAVREAVGAYQVLVECPMPKRAIELGEDPKKINPDCKGQFRQSKYNKKDKKQTCGRRCGQWWRRNKPPEAES